MEKRRERSYHGDSGQVLYGTVLKMLKGVTRETAGAREDTQTNTHRHEIITRMRKMTGGVLCE